MLQEKISANTAAGRLDLPPPDAAYLDLPDSFGRRVAVFVDTEEEFDWTKPLSRDERSTTAAASLPIIQQRMQSFGVQPVYLIDHPIATDERCVATLRDYQDAGACAVGTQLHPWVNPPFNEDVNKLNSFAGNLPTVLERAKLAVLTDAIENGVGRRPKVYRAGRYGVGPNTANLLSELGYKADVSVRATFDYGGEGGPDFSDIRPLPYRVGRSGLVELPLTAGYVGPLRGYGRSLFGAAGQMARGRGILARAGLLKRVALTPEGMPLADAVELIDRLLDDGQRLFSISFHSPSIEPGHTPYVRDARDLQLFHAWWDGVFGHCARRAIEPASIEQCLDAIAAARPLLR